MARVDPIIGTRFGHYIVRARVARSSEGEVFRAEDANLKAVALKVIDLRSVPPSEQEAALHRFTRAVSLWKSLDHPAIVRLVGAGRAGDQVFAATEWVEGPTLEALLHRRVRLPPAEAIALALRLAHGLEHAHARRVIHRDLKPANIFMAEDGPRLGDFGLATTARAGMSSIGATESGESVGTLAYMAPELASDARSADERTDIYGLGATLFHALSGKPPHTGGSLGSVLRSLLSGAPPLPDDVAGAGGFLGAVVSRALALRPEDRYASAAALAADLGVARSLGGLGPS